MNEQLLDINGVTICTESFGDKKNPAILLIMGAQSSMIWWEEEFCKRIADAGRFVIRYDNRDVGRSTTYEVGKPEYTFEDMADDAIGVLDAYGVEQAHIVGMSMGGMLTQIISLRHPSRVLSISLIATSNFSPELPPMKQKVIDFFVDNEEIDWTNKQSVIDFNVGKWKVIAGTKYVFDEERIHHLAEEEWNKSNNIASLNNHGFVSGGEEYLTKTSEINVPALVIHGTEDPIIPFEHGQLLAHTIPNATLLTLEGTGHELHYDDWDMIIEGIINHTSHS
jgi:pimeloyl-ACP methyl ester carboxylesterase